MARNESPQTDMPKFMLILRDDPRDFHDLTPAQMQAVLQRYTDWGNKLGERIEGGNKLTDSRDGASSAVLRSADDTVITDGPFGETKEVVGGFYLIEADDLPHAIELTRGHPQLDNGSIEIRMVDEMVGSATDADPTGAAAGH